MELGSSILFFAILREEPIVYRNIQTVLKSVGKKESYRDFKTSVSIFLSKKFDFLFTI